MQRIVPRIVLLAAATAIAVLAACSDRPEPTATDAAMSTPNAIAPASAILVAGGPTNVPMDSIRTVDMRDDPADIAARLRDAKLPGVSAPELVARSR